MKSNNADGQNTGGLGCLVAEISGAVILVLLWFFGMC